VALGMCDLSLKKSRFSSDRKGTSVKSRAACVLRRTGIRGNYLDKVFLPIEKAVEAGKTRWGKRAGLVHPSKDNA